MTHTPRDHDGGSWSPERHTAMPYGAAPDEPIEDPVRSPDASGSVPGDSFDDRLPHDTASSDASASTTDVAKGEAAKVKDTAVDVGKNVTATAKGEAANVVADTKAQAKSLLGSVTSEVQGQAGVQQQKIAASVHSLSQELTSMASGSEESGPLTDLAHQAANKGSEIAHWLEDNEPRDLLNEVKAFARRKPVTFLALCGLAGVVAGRLTRGAVAANTSLDSASTDHTSAPHAVESGGPSVAEDLPTTPQEPTASPMNDDVLTANPGPSAPGHGYQAADSEYLGERSGGVR